MFVCFKLIFRGPFLNSFIKNFINYSQKLKTYIKLGMYLIVLELWILNIKKWKDRRISKICFVWIENDIIGINIDVLDLEVFKLQIVVTRFSFSIFFFLYFGVFFYNLELFYICSNFKISQTKYFIYISHLKNKISKTISKSSKTKILKNPFFIRFKKSVK